jgi:beta-xylosidase
MKRLILFALACLSAVGVFAQTKTVAIQDINIRDPYILPDAKNGVYYMYQSSSVGHDGRSYGGVVAWKSRDLKTWEGPIRVFEVPHDNWITGGVWAPEVHKYNGKYYLSYSTGTTHYLVYAIGDSPKGPFTYAGRILEPVIGWTTHHSIVEYEGKWYLFYHDCVPSNDITHLRSLKVQRLFYDEKGNIQKVVNE